MSDNDLIRRGDAKANPRANGIYDLANENAHFIWGHESYRNWLDTVPAVQQEMSAREFLRIIEGLDYYDHEAYQQYLGRIMFHDYAGAVAIVEAWAREHLERSEDDGEM